MCHLSFSFRKILQDGLCIKGIIVLDIRVEVRVEQQEVVGIFEIMWFLKPFEFSLLK